MGRSPKAPSLVDMFVKNTMLLDVLMATIVTNVVMMVGWTRVAGRSVTRTCVTAMGVQDRPDLSEDTTAHSTPGRSQHFQNREHHGDGHAALDRQ